MPIVYEKLLKLEIPEVEHRYAAKDCILYALGLGLGQDPMNEDELAFVYEKSLKALPTMALVLGYTPYWLRNPESGVNWTKVVHGEQGFVLHRPVATEGDVVGQDARRRRDRQGRGQGRAGLFRARDRPTRRTGERRSPRSIRPPSVAATAASAVRLAQAPAPHALPERAPDMTCDLPTRPEMALIYRLSGDVNPLHAEPEFAQAPPDFRGRFCMASPRLASRVTPS